MANGANASSRDPRASRWRATWRFLVATLTLAVLYVAIGEIWIRVFAALLSIGGMLVDPATQAADEAAALARRSAAAEARLTPQHWRAAFRLGLQYGYLSSTERQSPDVRARRAVDAKRKEMDEHARFLGLGIVEPLPPSVEGLLVNRLQDDHDGIAARIEKATSGRLAHLFVLGAHVGDELSELELQDEFVRPPATPFIAEHGVLAGVPEPLWRPLTRLWTLRRAWQSDARTALADYQAAIETLDRYFEAGTLPQAADR